MSEFWDPDEDGLLVEISRLNAEVARLREELARVKDERDTLLAFVVNHRDELGQMLDELRGGK